MKRELDCVHLGDEIPTQGIRRQFVCTKGYGNVFRCIECQSCKDYATESGIVIGTYGMPELCELQVKVIRETCGSVPILIADDGSEKDAEFERIVESYDLVEFWTNPERKGHYAGDLSVFWKGLQWASVRGIKYLCKLSQRFIWTKQNWLHDAVHRLEISGQATMMQKCKDNGIDLCVRTECILLDVSRWCPLYRGMERGNLGNPTEFFIWDYVHRHFKSKFCPWSEMTVNRYLRTPDTLWHGSNRDRDFIEFARRYGIELKGFSVKGWEHLPNWKRG